MSIKNENLEIKTVMKDIGTFPVVYKDTILVEVLNLMDKFKLGIACVIDGNHKLIAVFTDGDFRRTLLNIQKPLSNIFVEDIIDYSTKNFTKINYDKNIVDALNIMGEKQIWDLPVTDEFGFLKGLLHLHPMINYLLDNS